MGLRDIGDSRCYRENRVDVETVNIIFLSRYCRKQSSFQVCSTNLLSGLLAVFILTSGATLWLGYQWGKQDDGLSDDLTTQSIQSVFDLERRELVDLRERTQEHLDALALRMGVMQAHILRLDALGERLIELGKLDNGEFNFDEAPPLGGDAEGDSSDQEPTTPDLLADLERLAWLIEDRERKLDVMEDIIMRRGLQKEVLPAGRPVKRGWISSYFGKRTDPFSGRKTMHKGIDFAGKKGSDVIAVAAGMVSDVGKQTGYGQVVEINHGNGVVTRYGHNQKVLVKKGDRIARGQTIANMGSSGRSTGPHVHFEVLRNGKQVNPAKYVRASL